MTDAQARAYKYLSEAIAEYDGPEREEFEFTVAAVRDRFLSNGVAAVTVRKKRVFIGMPRHSNIEPETWHAAHDAGSDGRVDAKLQDRCSSLLCAGFNECWADCVNGDFGPFDYFVLLHSDVRPQGKWIDEMIARCDEYDAIHVVAAIKDMRALTSTAVGPIDELFHRVRRITVPELLKMPDTFGYLKACEVLEEPVRSDWCLLPNTGCFMVKLGRWAIGFPGFTIRDRLVVRFPDGRSVLPNEALQMRVDGADMTGARVCAEVSPEDWNFGRWAASVGLRVGGTRGVKLDHFGKMTFPNYEPWGIWSRDEHYFSS